jgi:hypothetical protein
VTLVIGIRAAANDVNNGGIESSQTGSASKSGALAGRVVRLVRIVGFVKLFKYAAAVIKIRTNCPRCE